MSDELAVVFPGQGAQRDGMGADFMAEYPAARAIFDRAGEALGFSVADICHGADERLNLTEFTQPCIVTAEVAMLEALRAQYSLAPTLFAGHSLGEYSALVAAGAMLFDDAVRLVHLRGQLMQRAVPAGEGAMVALVNKEGLPLDTIRDVAAKHEVDVANENSPGQVVLSGNKELLEVAVEEILPDAEGVRATWLNVSAPFHCRHMANIEPEFRAALEGVRERLDASKATAVASNTLGGFHTGETDSLIDALTRQISCSVLWIDNMRAISERASTILEIGPQRPLRRFFEAMGVTVKSITNLRSAERACAEEKK